MTVVLDAEIHWHTLSFRSDSDYGDICKEIYNAYPWITTNNIIYKILDFYHLKTCFFFLNDIFLNWKYHTFFSKIFVCISWEKVVLSIFTWLKLKFLKQPLSVFLLKDTTSCERLTQRFKVLVFVPCECFILLCYVTASHISGFIYSEEANIHTCWKREYYFHLFIYAFVLFF